MNKWIVYRRFGLMFEMIMLCENENKARGLATYLNDNHYFETMVEYASFQSVMDHVKRAEGIIS